MRIDDRMAKFDRNFNIMRNFVITFIVIVFLLIAGVWIVTGVLGVKLYNSVESHGLKSVVEQIWYGNDKPEQGK